MRTFLAGSWSYLKILDKAGKALTYLASTQEKSFITLTTGLSKTIAEISMKKAEKSLESINNIKTKICPIK
jgi:hypothetical protein